MGFPSGANNHSAKTKIQDSLFTAMVQDEDCRYELYRALHPESMGIAKGDVRAFGIQSIFQNGIYNDACLEVIDRLLILTEHQSTLNFNMPLRFLLYLADEYKRVLGADYKEIFYEKRVMIPGPECYVVYTGSKKSPDEMWLSDAFKENTGVMSLKVKVISEESDSIIGQYIGFSKYVKNGRHGPGGISQAVRDAIAIYDKSEAFTRFLKSGRDVVNMFMEEITFQDVLEAREEECLERGLKEGLERGREEGRERERVNAIWRMLGIGLTEAQILSMGYTSGEIEKSKADAE